jgi:nucleoside-diphosphate-sugar epimerase
MPENRVKILVTGGAGNVGGALAEALAGDPSFFVVVVDNLRTGSLDKLPRIQYDNFRFIKADVNNLADLSSVMLSWHFDYVFHYAALVGVKKTLANPIDVLNDIDGIRNVLNLSKNTGVKRVFFSSSSEVYGEPVEFPQNEYTTPLNSRLPYAIVKNVAEAFFRSYHKEYGLDYTIFRFFNTYGPKQSNDFVVSRFIDLALRNEPITLYGDGRQTRTFCYIDDNIEATLRIFKDGHYINDVVNLGSHIETPIADLARRVIEITNSKSTIVNLPPLEEGDMTRRLPDNAKMLSVLGRELLPLEDGIRNVLRIRFGKDF